jgi:hypothetical protein
MTAEDGLASACDAIEAVFGFSDSLPSSDPLNAPRNPDSPPQLLSVHKIPFLEVSPHTHNRFHLEALWNPSLAVCTSAPCFHRRFSHPRHYRFRRTDRL